MYRRVLKGVPRSRSVALDVFQTRDEQVSSWKVYLAPKISRIIHMSKHKNSETINDIQILTSVHFQLRI